MDKQENKQQEKKSSGWGKAIWTIVIVLIFFGVKSYMSNSSNDQAAAPALPQGLSSTDEIMSYIGNHEKSNEQISLESAMAQMNQDKGSDVQEQLQNDPVIFVMKNKETGRYVFKYKNHYVYLIREITDFYSDGSYSYMYFVTGIKKDDDGKLYVKKLDAKKYDDSNAKETDGYSIDDYNNYYGMDEDD
ncbi:hypothetical protein [Companilactobacillus ginsenosidimutans]|uniref:Uncharacterized protein n=1 Tax=Companilactobacillus ginsenosidimutans TaxID=1007676 RepID=A0A0H4QHC8_9LACO|nr:hypothetical protein [Companilactobacillus ginsenosidimutans]AKP67819.1 hypothetical protein ABM34_09940 [Companilactobacillus ginsenosidimutans]